MSADIVGKLGQTGGCQCGAIRYRLEAVPDGEVICHCRMCQKATGGAFSAFCGVPAAAFIVVRGTISVFQSSEIAQRGFCASCGTPLTYQVIGSKRIGITIGSLDEPNAVTPKEQLGMESRVKWLDAALKAHVGSLSDWLKSRQIDTVGSRQHPDHELM